jgi:ATP-dependent DNA helicase RecG
MDASLKELLSGGETVHIEYKSAGVRPESFARELAAFSNSLGGTILVGIEDDASISGLPDDRRWDEWASNIARNAVNPC